MQSWLAKPSLWLGLMLLSGAAQAATEIGLVTLADGTARLLRGATWYKLAAGLHVEEGDIVEATERAQVQLDFTSGTIASLVGPTVTYLSPAKSPLAVLTVPGGWVKIVAKAPGVRVLTTPFAVETVDGIVVLHAAAPAVDFFVEAGSARIVETAANGTDGPPRDAKRGEYWAKPATGAFITVPLAPRSFVAAMPRHFADALPVLAPRIKSKPVLIVDHEITYAEAEPWLAGRDRALFEKRFAVRLRDPAFRKTVKPVVAR